MVVVDEVAQCPIHVVWLGKTETSRRLINKNWNVFHFVAVAENKKNWRNIEKLSTLVSALFYYLNNKKETFIIIT